MTRKDVCMKATKSTPSQANPGDNTQKNPKDWVTGGEPATGAQKSYLHTLGQETGVNVPDDLSKGEASEKINELKQIDPRTANSK